MIEWFLASGLPEELIVFLVSAVPVIELRGAMPLAINVFHMPWYQAFPFAFLGNMLPVPFILLFLESVARVLRRTGPGRKFVSWVFARTRRHSGIIVKYERIGLALFVAIPLPFTGAWTGSIAAFLMGLGLRYSLISITIGVIIAGFILVILSLLGWVGAVIAVVLLIALAILGWWRL